jgi:hypothetical protein
VVRAAIRALGAFAFLAAAVTVTMLPPLAGAAAAAPLDPTGQDWEGLSQFVDAARAQLGAQRVVVRSTLSLSDLHREDALVLVHPENTLDVDELQAFMRAGGRIVVLDDYGKGDELLGRFGIRRVPLPLRPAEMLRGNSAFAIAEPASTHEVARDVGRVVTNRATGLEQRALSEVLVVRGDGEPDVLVSVAGAVGQGRLLAVGDSSIVMNSMLRYPGNRSLALNLVRYASEDDVWGKRDGKLYVLANGFETTGSFANDSRFGGTAGDIQHAMADALESVRHDGLPTMAAYLLALAGGLGIIAWTTTQAGRPHKAATPRFVRPVSIVAQGGVAGRTAALVAPGTSRTLAALEVKSALEEDIATRLGLDHAPAPRDLAQKALAAGLFDKEQSEELGRLLEVLAHMEVAMSVQRQGGRGGGSRVRDADVFAIAARARHLLEAVRLR